MKYFHVIQKSIDKFQLRLDPFWLGNQSIATKEYPVLILFEKGLVGYRIFFHKGFQRG